MIYYGIVSLFNGLVTLSTGIYVLLKNRKNSVHVSFSLFAISVGCWAILYSIWQAQSSKPLALLFNRLLMLPVYYIPFAFLWFVLTILEIEDRDRYQPVCLIPPTLFLMFSFTALNVKDVMPKLYFPYWAEPGLLMHVFVAIFFITITYSFYLLFRAWFRASGMRRWQIRWVTITTLFAWTGGSTNWFLWYDIPIPPIANIFVGVSFLLLAYAVIRRHLFDVDALSDIVRESKLSAIGTLTASINHEIRNPLYVVRGFAESCLASMKDGLWTGLSVEERERRIEEVLQKTVEQVNRAVEITKRLSEFAKPKVDEAKPEAVRLSEVVENVLSFVGYELDIDKIKVEQEIHPDTIIRADRKHMEEVLLNLVINACQAMPRGGLLKISDQRRDGHILIRVSDTGVGIPRNTIKRIFEPFFSTKQEKGTGLGLYIVKKLVERNSGRVSVESKIGFGSIFTLEFPCEKKIIV